MCEKYAIKHSQDWKTQGIFWCCEQKMCIMLTTSFQYEIPYIALTKQQWPS
jgi:hypothetical protein